MRNADIIKRLPRLEALRTEAAAAEREAKAQWARSQALSEEIRELGRVTEVLDGVALQRVGGFVAAAGEEITRCAEVYPNAHNNGRTYGLHTYTDAFGRQGERWWGAGWERSAAQAAADTWVVQGIAPAEARHDRS